MVKRSSDSELNTSAVESRKTLMFAIATNACAHDFGIISYTLPSWLRVFGNRLEQVHIIVDERSPSGRIASNRAHDRANPELLREVLARFASADSRIRVSNLGELPQEQYLRKWFTAGCPDRCQAGTPILPFVAAFEAPAAEFVLRADCDMLFYDNGWLDAAKRLLRLGHADLVEPPRLSYSSGSVAAPVSTRALMIQQATFHRLCLPFLPHRLDLFRRVHRRFYGRPAWLALEQMLDTERRCGRIRHVILDNALGFSLHVDQRSFPSRKWVAGVIERIETGDVTLAQVKFGWNFSTEAWLERV